jgi:tetratricopeptide (TPR) repeat protein
MVSPGTKLGPYQVVEHLGSGGMGEVYLAHDCRLDRRVAVKLLPECLAADNHARERLRHEALAAAALDHPFICKIFEVAEDNGTLICVMEYVRGETLQARLSRGRLANSEAMRIAGELAEAIEEAHANRFIHRDLKPANVMITPQGHVKVMDFGLAKREISANRDETLAGDCTQLTGLGGPIGTLDYMSPEQVTGASIDHRSDLFAFGIILCELAIGKHPFRRISKMATITAILRDPPDLATVESPAVQPGLMLMIRRLLSKSPDERYQSMSEARADLNRLATVFGAEPSEKAAPKIPLIGREQERAELLRLLDSALNGQGSLALVGGEAGIGKTHLTRAILAEASRRGFFTVVGHCYEKEGAPPYVPFIEMLEYSARTAPRESFRYAVGDAAPEVAKLMPELRRMFPDIPPSIELPQEQQRRFLFNAYREFVERSARLTPIVAVFEDLHWADEPTLLLLKHLAETVGTTPMLMIGTYHDVELEVTRPFASTLESLMRDKLALRIPLHRLSLAGVQAMIAALSGKTPPASLTQIVFEETDGNPFFVEEVFHHLAEEGQLFNEQGAWRAGLRRDQLHVPESVRLVIGRRLERLGGEARRVLTTGAVIGRSFSLRLLEELEGAQSEAMLDALDSAERAHVVVSEEAGREPRYRFVHELIRQTLAEALSLPRRQRLHARIADAIERLYGANLEAQASALAHHLYQAGAAADLEKTINYLLLAARLASGGAAHEEALGNIENALSLLEGAPHPRAAELHVAKAAALRSISRFAEAVDSYERAIELYVQAGNAAAVASSSFDLGYIYAWEANGARACTVVDRAIQFLGREPSLLGHRLLLLKAVSLAVTGDLEAALATFSEAKAIEEVMPETRADGFASMCEARLRWMCAQIAQADECAREARIRFRASGDLWGEAELFEPISAALWLGSPTEAETLLRDSLSRAERVGHQNAAWTCKAFAAQMHMACGNLHEAELAARDSFEYGCSFSGSWNFISTAVLGSIAHYRGQFDEAVRWFRGGLETEPQSYMQGLLPGGLFWTLAGCRDPEADTAFAKARLHLPVPGRQLSVGACACLAFAMEGLALLGRYEQAAALQPHAEHVVAKGPLCVYSLHLFRTSAGMAAGFTRNWSRAEEHHRAAMYQADTAPYRVAQPTTRAWYAEMLLARDEPGDRQRARVLLSEALSLHQSMGMSWHARKVAERVAAL